MSVLEVGLPSTASALVRLILVIVTTLAFHVCMTKPNPPPSTDDRKQVSRLENALIKLLKPSATCFSLAPGFIELTAVSIRLAVPPAYNIVSGTCTERISFNVPALVGCLLSLCGMGIRLWCYQTLGRLFTFELALLPDHRLVTTGPYAFVRHPSYTGGFLALVGITLTNISKGSWAYECGFVFSWWGIGWGMIVGVSTIVMVDRCPREDRLLRGTFTEEWDAWREQVRWQIVPWVF